MGLKQRLILDFDGTIVNSIQAVVDCYNDDYQQYPGFTVMNWWDINTWDFEELALADKRYIDQLWNQPRFFRRLNFMDWAEEVLLILKDEYKIEIATLGNIPNLNLKRLWISEHMPYVEEMHLIDLNQHTHKSHVDMSNGICIDDTSINLTTSNAANKILFGDSYPWNLNWDGLRCYNWNDILSLLSHTKMENIVL